MALRALLGKLRGPPAVDSASRVISVTCVHCGKTTSTRIAVPLGQDGAIKNCSSVDRIESPLWKHYLIRVTSVVTSCTLSWIIIKGGVACIEDELLYGSKK